MLGISRLFYIKRMVLLGISLLFYTKNKITLLISTFILFSFSYLFFIQRVIILNNFKDFSNFICNPA